MKKTTRFIAAFLLVCLLGSFCVNSYAAADKPAVLVSSAESEADEGNLLKGILLGVGVGAAAILVVAVGYRLGQHSVLGRKKSRRENEADS